MLAVHGQCDGTMATGRHSGMALEQQLGAHISVHKQEADRERALIGNGQRFFISKPTLVTSVQRDNTS